MRKNLKIILALTITAIFCLNVVKVNAQTITGTQDDTVGVWLFSAGTDVPGGQPTDEIVGNAITAGILEYIGDEATEVTSFFTGPPDTGESSRDTTLFLVTQGLETIDDFGLIEEADDPSSNFDSGEDGLVNLGNFGDIHSDGVVATGTIGPDTGVDPEVALGGFEIFIFEDAELSGFSCTLTKRAGGTITFAIDDRQVDPPTEAGADDTLIAIDLDSIPGFSESDTIASIMITDNSISMTPPLQGDTTLELDAVATRISVLLGSISGYKWNDLDGDGVWDGGEPGLSGWTIHLTGAATATTTTGAGGYYEFTGLAEGTYTVSETSQAGWTRTYPSGAGTHTIVLDPGEVSNNNNFGNRQPLGSISGYKWNDLDGDGVWDGGEPGLSGWTIHLTGAATATTTTGAGGYYIFSSLNAGTYTVSEDLLPGGWVRTYPPSPGTHTIVLTTGQASSNKNFGNWIPPPSVGGEGQLINPTLTIYLPIILMLAISLMGAVSYKAIKKNQAPIV